MIRTLDEIYKTTNILWAVSAFPGGSMDSNKLCTQLLAQTASLNKFGVTADEEFMKKLRLHDSNKIHPQSPPFFKCCILDVVDFKDKKVELVFQNWSLALVGDSCNINKKAGEIVTEQIGLLLPTTRCSANRASDNIKRMSSSQTMSVLKVVTFDICSEIAANTQKLYTQQYEPFIVE